MNKGKDKKPSRRRTHDAPRTELTLRQRRADAARRFDGRTMKITDYGDYDILHLVDDNEGQPTVTFAEITEIEPKSVAIRFAWLVRKGLLRNNQLTSDRQHVWFVAPAGRKLLNSHGTSIEALQTLARDLSRSPATGWVARREFGRNLK